MQSNHRTVLAAAAAGAALLLLPAGASMAQGSFGKTGPSSPPVVKGAERTPPEAAARTKPEVLRMSRDVEKSLGKLPPDRMVEIDGKAMRIKDVRAREARLMRQESARLKAQAGPFVSRLAEIGQRLERAQQAEIEKHNARIMAEVARIKRQGQGTAPAAARGSDAIKAEARAIQERVEAGTATPQDEARARALLEEFQKLQ